jgi:hypothetical protein
VKAVVSTYDHGVPSMRMGVPAFGSYPCGVVAQLLKSPTTRGMRPVGSSFTKNVRRAF